MNRIEVTYTVRHTSHTHLPFFVLEELIIVLGAKTIQS